MGAGDAYFYEHLLQVRVRACVRVKRMLTKTQIVDEARVVDRTMSQQRDSVVCVAQIVID